MDKLSNPENPKDIIGQTKLSLDLVPDSLVTYAALAFTEGALKYGRYNWRITGVRVSVYISALRRHISKYMAGEWADPDTQVPHLASALACIGIILDAQLSGKLNDDRPPTQWIFNNLLDEKGKEILAHLKELYKDKNPHQYTWKDDPEWQNDDDEDTKITEQSLDTSGTNATTNLGPGASDPNRLGRRICIG